MFTNENNKKKKIIVNKNVYKLKNRVFFIKFNQINFFKNPKSQMD